MEKFTRTVVMLLVIGVVALAADMAPPGQDRVSVPVLTKDLASSVELAPEIVAVETEVAEVAREGPISWPVTSGDVEWLQPVGSVELKCWRAWNAQG